MAIFHLDECEIAINEISQPQQWETYVKEEQQSAAQTQH